MCYNSSVDSLQKLKAVSLAARMEDPEEGRQTSGPLTCDNLPIFNAVVSGGRNIRLLKSLLTSVCENNCAYCGIRWAKDSRRVTFSPDEMADLFLRLHRVGACEGLFLSSGIAGGGVRTQDKLIAAAEIIRRRGYKGYLHLKIMPGSEREQVMQAMRLANRVSINLEAPTAASLAAIAPKKNADALFEPLRWIEEIRRSIEPRGSWNGRWPSSSTQFVVGAGGESDRDLLGMAQRLRREAGLARVHYSTFEPAEGTPLEEASPENPQRSFRLYQADFLIRDYGFDAEELLQGRDRLPLHIDPKLSYARIFLLEDPVEINRADRRDLLRIPGIGPRTVGRILDARRGGSRIRSVEDLKRLGVNTPRASDFLLVDGRKIVTQMRLF
ncbi:MAG: radical SAM protein [Anaerolineales bacterium]|nr:radical SAM protein [Anaerolineales bacterium]